MIHSDYNRMRRVFISPTVTVLLAFSLFPLLWSLGISFTDIQRSGSTSARSEAPADPNNPDAADRGGFRLTLRNFGRIATDQRLHIAARNTLFYVIIGVLLQYLLGFLLALTLNQPFWGRNLFRVLFLMPMMTMPVAAAYTWRMLYDTSLSPIAHLLRLISQALNLQEALVIPWLTSSAVAPLTVVLIDTWQWTPFMMLLLLAGMQSIPTELTEAARVAGASPVAIFRHITFPLMLPLSLTAILIRGLEIFKIIDIIVVTTGGGPGSSTESLTMYIYKTALTFGNYSYAAAISFALLVIVILFSTIFLLSGQRLARRWEH